MKKSVILFAVFLLVLIVAVVSERREEKDFSNSVAMGDETGTQLVTPSQDLEIDR
ncbi:hypothetical protein LVD13_12430 [Flavobacteriaceae bacterium D16]|nr:hypothetical protein [Flavobacteriaceae bacterium D16]